MNNKKAKVAEVDYGFAKVQGLELPNGEYRIGVSQIAEFFQLDKTIATREVKALLGKDCQLVKVYSELNPKPVNTVNLKQFAEICLKLAIRWNKTAEAFCLAAIEETHERRFDKAFNKQRSEEEYNARMKARMAGKRVRRTLTDAIKDWLERNDVSENTKKFIYSNVTDIINLGIFNRRAMKLRKDWNCDNPRDNMTENELRWVSEVEDLAMRLIDNHNFHPLDAAKEAVNRLMIEKVIR